MSILSAEVAMEGVKCEKLEKIVIDDDMKFFFSVWTSVASSREGKADSFS